MVSLSAEGKRQPAMISHPEQEEIYKHASGSPKLKSKARSEEKANLKSALSSLRSGPASRPNVILGFGAALVNTIWLAAMTRFPCVILAVPKSFLVAALLIFTLA
jgi:hypothetical protein